MHSLVLPTTVLVSALFATLWAVPNARIVLDSRCILHLSLSATVLYDPHARIAGISNARHESQRFQCATLWDVGPTGESHRF